MVKKLAFLPVLGLFLLSTLSGSAQQYLINLTATYRTTNGVGLLANGKMSVPTLLTEITGDAPSARTMTLVYDINTGEIIVVQKATGAVLGTWYQLEVDTTVSSHDGVKSECYWDITCPADDGYRGSAIGTVTVVRGIEDEIIKFKMQGKFTLRYQGENGATRVYSGVFSTGARYNSPAAASR